MISNKLEIISLSMEIEAVSELEQLVATRLKALRLTRGLTLDQLAERSGVSRSMISCIERAESNPTARVLDRLAASLGVSLATLFADEARSDAAPLVRRDQQSTWRDPETGYVRRTLSPAGFPSPLMLVEVSLPSGTRVGYDSGPRTAVVHHQAWVIEGTLEVTYGEDVYRLGRGDCLAFRVDRPIAYRNPGAKAARYILASTTGPVSP